MAHIGIDNYRCRSDAAEESDLTKITIMSEKQKCHRDERGRLTNSTINDWHDDADEELEVFAKSRVQSVGSRLQRRGAFEMASDAQCRA